MGAVVKNDQHQGLCKDGFPHRGKSDGAGIHISVKYLIRSVIIQKEELLSEACQDRCYNNF